MAAAAVNNYLAHLSALFSWITVHAPARLLRLGDPTKKVEPLPLPAPQVRALAAPQVRTVKNVLDRIEGFHQLNGRRYRGGGASAVHRHSRPLRDRAIVHLILGTGLRRAEVTGLDLDQLDPAGPAKLRRVKKARLNGVRGKGRTSRTVFLGRDARHAITTSKPNGPVTAMSRARRCSWPRHQSARAAEETARMAHITLDGAGCQAALGAQMALEAGQQHLGRRARTCGLVCRQQPPGGRKHYSGWYWSSTTDGLVVYESRLELARIMLADFAPEVIAIEAQPFRLIGADGHRIRSHVPDILHLPPHVQWRAASPSAS
jgi:Phage integrase family